MIRHWYLLIKAHYWWAPLPATAIFLLGAWLGTITSNPGIREVYLVYEVVFPLVCSSLVPMAITAHLHQRVAELESTLPPNPLLRPVFAFAPGFLLMIASGVIVQLAVINSFYPIGLLSAISITMPPLVALMGLAALGATLGRRAIPGILLCWLFGGIDIVARHEVNRWAYLFPLRFPKRLPLEEIAEWQGQMHLGAISLGIASLSVAAVLINRRERWVRHD